jgi:Fic family protein
MSMAHASDASEWPSISAETLVWEPASGTGSRITDLLPRPYSAAVPPLIAELNPALDSSTLQLAAEAEKELARFDAAHGEQVASFAPVLLRSEAASSSQIENLTASARAILSAELGAKRGGNAEQIAGNTRALAAAIQLAQSVTAPAILQMHSLLMASQPRHTPGEFRTEAVWIGARSDSPAGADYVAPRAERVPALIDDLVRFAQRRDQPAFVVTALAHAQFETIHPFTDGNGRTGRALAQSLLRHHDVTKNLAVPVSAGLLADVAGYHSALTAYRSGDIAPIVRVFADAAFRAIGNAEQLITEIREIRAGWETQLTARRNSNAWRLLDVLMRRPVLNSSVAAEELGVQQPNVYPPLKKLVEAGILLSKNEHRLGPFWRSDEVLAALDAFAERAGRRQRT